MNAARLQAAFFADGPGQIMPHAHDLLEFILVLEGEIVTECGPVRWEAAPGHLLTIPAGMPHDQRCAGDWRTACLLLAPGLLPGEEIPRRIDLKFDPMPRRWIEDLCQIRSGLDPQADALSDLLLSVLLARLSPALPEAPLHPALAAAVRLLQERLPRPVTREDLAASVCVSPGHLAALFSERYGVGPVRFQQRLRLQQACRLLENPYLSLDAVARQCGYDDPNYFARLFKREYGLPPGRWRAQGRLHAGPPGE